MNPQTRLLLIRHGEVEVPYQRVFGGRIDMGLSPRGLAQAQHLADHVRGLSLAALYASPQRRAQQTLRPIIEGNGHGVVTLDSLREVDFGAWTGLSWEQVHQRFGVSAFDWLQRLDDGTIPDAERSTDFRARVGSALQKVETEHRGETVGWVCHGGVIRMALAILLDLPLPRTAAFEIDYASVTVVDWRPRRVEIQLLNFTPWRPLPEWVSTRA